MIGAGVAILGAMAALHGAPAQCPSGVPTQTVTVANDAKVGPLALAKVENALVEQSMQVRAAWGTPCVEFGSGGWLLTLLVGGTAWGVHYDGPSIRVYTGGYAYKAWSEDFSHEIVETLVDPTTTRGYYAPGHGLAGANYGPVEVADPVETLGYPLDGVYVSDFVTPAYFAGALEMPTVGCNPPQGVLCGPPITSASAGPYDEQGKITQPWQIAASS